MLYRDDDADSPQLHRESEGHIVLLHMGGLGDIVLASEWISSLKVSVPTVRLTLICKADFASVADLFPSAPDETIGLQFDPAAWSGPSAALIDALENASARLSGLRPDLLVDGMVRPIWFTQFIVSLLRPRRAIGGASPPSGALAKIVQRRLGLQSRDMQLLKVPPGLHERERYRLLSGQLGLRQVESFPWTVSDNSRSKATGILRQLGMRPFEYVACFPGGAATARIKRWPDANFVEAALQLRQHTGLATLFIGNHSEANELESMARGSNDPTIKAFCGGPGDFECLAGLLSLARGYVGNDTGPVHLAQAFDVPGVGIFGGGGEWPIYAPWGKGSIGIVHPLPCFGCGWDCFLGRAHCVETIPVQPVVAALLEVLASPGRAPRVDTLNHVDDPTRHLLSDASAMYRMAQKDRAERYELLLEAELSMSEQSLQVARLQDVADEQRSMLARHRDEIALRDREIEELRLRVGDDAGECR